MIEQIISDAKAMEAEAIRSEEDAQKAYEDFVKDPITDPGKKSKKGKLTLELRDNVWVTVAEGKGQPDDDKLVEVFRHGELLVDEAFTNIRERAEFVTS